MDDDARTCLASITGIGIRTRGKHPFISLRRQPLEPPAPTENEFVDVISVTA